MRCTIDADCRPFSIPTTQYRGQAPKGSLRRELCRGHNTHRISELAEIFQIGDRRKRDYASGAARLAPEPPPRRTRPGLSPSKGPDRRPWTRMVVHVRLSTVHLRRGIPTQRFPRRPYPANFRVGDHSPGAAGKRYRQGGPIATSSSGCPIQPGSSATTTNVRVRGWQTAAQGLRLSALARTSRERRRPPPPGT